MTSDTRPDVLALAEALPRTHDAGPDDAAHLVALLAHRGWRLTQSPEPEKVGTAAPGHGRTLPPPQAPDESVGRLREALEKVTERLHSLGVPTGPWQECDRGLCAVANDALATTPQPGPISPARPVEPPAPDERDATIAMLREAAQDYFDHASLSREGTGEFSDREWLSRRHLAAALTNTAQAAQERDERLVKPWREALRAAQKALGSHLWVADNVENADTARFREFFDSATIDARLTYEAIDSLLSTTQRNEP